jgi:hypothetical protein
MTSGNTIDAAASAEVMKQRFAAIEAELERLGYALFDLRRCSHEERARFRDLLRNLTVKDNP